MLSATYGAASRLGVGEIHSMFNHRSGLVGLVGENDFRRLHAMIESCDSSAQSAYGVFIHRVRKCMGAYRVVLGYADVLSFTTGVGENDTKVRRDVLTSIGEVVMILDKYRNFSAWKKCIADFCG